MTKKVRKLSEDCFKTSGQRHCKLTDYFVLICLLYY